MSSVESTTTEPAAAPTELVLVEPPVAEQMRGLDFLLGTFQCEWTIVMDTPPRTGTVVWSAEHLLDGHYVRQVQHMEGPPRLNAHWVFGWNQVLGNFAAYYYDDWGNQGYTTSPGWEEDGKLKFTGQYSAFGKPHLCREEFEVVDENHFTKRGYVHLEGEWVHADVIECRRV
ncbi:DUF1579 family protein [Plantactinospora sp. DSM 117369]